MSNQSQANQIFNANNTTATRASRSDIIAKIIDQTGVSAAYASTLYNNASKNARKHADVKAANTKPAAKSSNKSSNKITKFDRDNLKAVRTSIEAALAAVAAQYGINLEVGGISYQDNQFTTKLSVTTGNKEESGRNDWNRYCALYNMNKNDFGRTFTHGGNTYTITGVLPRRRKFPIVATNVLSGKKSLFPADFVAGKVK